MEIYIVQPGDTPASIAAQYGVSPQRLIFDNQLAGLPYLPAGMAILVLFPALIHTVSEGETPESIAEQYEITEKQLFRNNPFLLNQDYLRVGQSLVIHYRTEPKNYLSVAGYTYPFIEMEILRETLLYLEDLLVFSYGFTETGELIPPQLPDEWIIQMAWEMGVRPILVLTPFSKDRQFNNHLVNIVSEDLEVQQALIQNLLDIVREKGYAGVDVDFEYVLPGDRAGYAAFVGNLHTAMSAEGYQVSVALAPKISAAQPGILYEGMDYGLLGENTDQVFLMTYEWGYTFGPPMAVAPLNKVREVLNYAVTEIPREQIRMGIPNYGYDWKLPFQRGISMAELLGNVEAVRRAAENGAPIQFDETAQSPYYRYMRDGITHEVWFEDVRSIQAKVETALEYDLLGIGYWNLMQPFRVNWLLLNGMLRLE